MERPLLYTSLLFLAILLVYTAYTGPFTDQSRETKLCTNAVELLERREEGFESHIPLMHVHLFHYSKKLKPEVEESYFVSSWRRTCRSNWLYILITVQPTEKER
jgi:hypothetical protein